MLVRCTEEIVGFRHRIADPIERVNQGVLVVGPESNAEVHRDAGRRESQALPVHQDSIPCIFPRNVVPAWCGVCREVAERPSDSGNQEKMVAHGYRVSPRWCQP